MIVCNIWDAEYPWDVRVQKMSAALTSAGHQVHLLARNRHREPLIECRQECTVHRLAPLAYVGTRFDAASQFPAFFNPRWVRFIERTARTVQADVLLVRNLPLAPTAVWVGRRLELPVVLDMADNYPAMIRDLWTTGTQGHADVLIRNPYLVAAVERWTLRRITHVLAVVEESCARLIASGVSDESITLVSNTPPLTQLRMVAPHRDADHPTPGEAEGDTHLRVVYVGQMERNRGIETAVEAVDRCRAMGVSIRLSLIGDGRDLPVFKRLACALRLAGGHVVFRGHLPHADAMREMMSADIGLIPHFPTEHCHTTVPNKLFDYMGAGLPVVASNLRPIERILGETKAGVVFRGRDAGHLASVLAELARAPDRRRAMGEAGRHAVRTKYNWSVDARRLVTAIEYLKPLRMSQSPMAPAILERHQLGAR